MNNDDLILKMILDESGFTAGMNNAVRKLGDFDGEVSRTGDKGSRSLGNIWTSFVGNFLASGAQKIISTGFGMIQESISGAISRLDTLNNSTRVFENMGFTAGETEATMEALKDSINGLPTSLDSAVSGVQLIASSTEDLGKSEQIFSALNNGILGFGGSAEMVDNAVMQLSQSFSNGKVDAQTWNSMINSGLGPALNALAKQMGLTTGEMKAGLSDGTISVETFQDALIDLNKNGGGGLKSLETIAQDATAGIGTGLENMKTAVTRGMANVIESIDNALKDAGFGGIGQVIANVGSAFEKALSWVAANIPNLISGFKEFKDTIEPFIPVIVGVATGFTALRVVDGMPKKISALKDSFKSLTGAFNLIVAHPVIFAVSALAAGIVYLWTTNEDFRKAVIDIWEDIKKAFSGAAEWAVNAWEGVKDFFSDLWTGIKQTTADTIDAIKQTASDAAQGVINAWNGIKQFFRDIWTGIKTSAKNMWDSFVDTVITPVYDAISDLFGPLIDWFGGLWGSIQTISAEGWELIKNAVMGPILILMDLITGDFGSIGGHVSEIWNNILESATVIWTTIADTVSGFNKAAAETAMNLWNSFKDGLGLIWDSIKETATNSWESLKETVGTAVTTVRDNAVATWDNLKTAMATKSTEIKDGTVQKFEDMKTGVSEKISGFVAKAQDAWEDLKTGVSETVDKVKGFFESLGDIDLFQIGKDMIQGLIDGVTEKMNAVKDSVVGVADGIKGWITDALDIHSPSRWMREMIGYNIPLGVAEGIEARTSAVQQSMDSMADAIKQPIDIASVFGNEDQASVSVSGTRSTVPAQGGDTFNIYLQTLGDLSEKALMDLANKLVRYIQIARNRDYAPQGGAFNGI